mmetsp:Transcript_772/g.1695  ORF Transcript_772/g.1695 Transcript_772/m.1695 type:complete len:107 (-) Transcript_772:1994-2314(-)
MNALQNYDQLQGEIWHLLSPLKSRFCGGSPLLSLPFASLGILEAYLKKSKRPRIDTQSSDCLDLTLQIFLYVVTGLSNKRKQSNFSVHLLYWNTPSLLLCKAVQLD